MNVILIKALQLLLCLSLLVVLHEGGHFGFAKLFKTRVTRFYMFSNWGFHLFSTYDNWFRRLLGKPLITKRGKEGQNLFAWLRNMYYRLTRQSNKIQTEGIGNKEYDPEVGTEYGIGWLPIGGYVAIAGMIGGVLMNLITAFVIYCGVMFFVGEDRLPMENIKRGFAFNPEAEALGFRDGDIPIKADGEALGSWSSQVLRDVVDAETVTVLRDGKEVSLTMPQERPDLIQVMKMQPAFMAPISIALVDSVLADGPAATAGIKAGARLLAVDGTDIQYWNDYDSLYLRRQACVRCNLSF